MSVGCEVLVIRMLVGKGLLGSAAIRPHEPTESFAVQGSVRDECGDDLCSAGVLALALDKSEQDVEALVHQLGPMDERAAPLAATQLAHVDVSRIESYNKHMTLPAGHARARDDLMLSLEVGPVARSRPEPVRIGERTLSPTPVFDTYWTFAAARHAVYMARVAGRPGPWTSDPILRRHRFTNCYRASDRVSQFLISDVTYDGRKDWDEVFFRTLLFKFFNRISTWHLLRDRLGEIRWDQYRFDAYNDVLNRAFARGTKLYSAAYVMPAPRLGEVRKHSNHLKLLELMMHSQAPQRIQDAGSMQAAFEILRNFPGMGDFLAYQFLIDLNYSEGIDYDEMEYVVPGPGARDGIRKCFGPDATGIEREIIAYMADSQEHHFERLGLSFPGLWGRRLQLIDCQNLFCEVDKYARVAHPEIRGLSGRSRIKQSYKPVLDPVPAWFPPKWAINARIDTPPGRVSSSPAKASDQAEPLLLPL